LDHWPGLRRTQERFVAGGQRGGSVAALAQGEAARTVGGSSRLGQRSARKRSVAHRALRPAVYASSGWTSGRVERCLHQCDSRHLRLHRGRTRAGRSPCAGLCHVRGWLPRRVSRRRRSREPSQWWRMDESAGRRTRWRASLKLGLFTPVFGGLAVQTMLAKVQALGKVQALEIGTGGWPGNGHLDMECLLGDKGRLANYRSMIADAGLTISALSCHGHPLPPNAEVARQYDDVFRKTVCLAHRME